MKEVLIEILKRSALLAGLLAVGSLGVLLTLRADTLSTVLGTVFAPLLTVLVVIVRAYFKNKGNLTVKDVDAAFDEAQDAIDSTK